jgi:hypothetical protein
LGVLAGKPDQNFTFLSSLLNLKKLSPREGGREGGTHVFFECKVLLLGEENKRSYISSSIPNSIVPNFNNFAQ